jgi:hypothetical protein
MPTSAPKQISDEPEPPTTRKQLAADSPLHPVSLAAGAGAAAVAAVIGGRLGLSGTVIGAAVGSIVAALTATAIRASVHRSRAAAVALAIRRRGGTDPVLADTVADEHPEPAPTSTPWTGWARGAITVTAGFALGIAGILLLQLGLGRNLSPGTDQLASVAAKVVVASPTATSAHPSATVTTTVTKTASATPSPTSAHTDGSATFPVPTQAPAASTTPSATPTLSASATP